MTNFSGALFPLESYGYNLTQLAGEGIFPPLYKYDAWVTRVFDILRRKEKTSLRYNPVLIDGDETHRWQVVMEVLRHLSVGDSLSSLASFQVVAPNFTALCGTSSFVEQYNIGADRKEDEMLAQLLSWPSSDVWDSSDVVLPRFEAFFSAACQAENLVLLLNDFHRLFGGEPNPYAVNMLNVLIPALARRQIRFIGISTLIPFRQYIELNAAIECRVQPIML